MITLGQYLPERHSEQEGLRVLCDAPELAPHVDRSWFRAYLAERLDIALPASDPAPARSRRVAVGDDLLARHLCVCGATGSGKTRLALHLLSEQIRMGCSVVMLDPKLETIRHLMQFAQTAGVRPSPP